MRFFKSLLLYFMAYFLALLLSSLFSSVVFVPLCVAVFGENIGLIISPILENLSIPLMAYTMIYSFTKKDADKYKYYTRRMEGKSYALAEDIKNVIADGDFIGELLIVIFLTIVFFIRKLFQPYILINVPVFIILYIMGTLRIHKLWIELRDEEEEKHKKYSDDTHNTDY